MGLYTQTAAAIWLFLTLTHHATSALTFETRELGFADYPQCSVRRERTTLSGWWDYSRYFADRVHDPGVTGQRLRHD